MHTSIESYNQLPHQNPHLEQSKLLIWNRIFWTRFHRCGSQRISHVQLLPFIVHPNREGDSQHNCQPSQQL
jgi:hypothetical protein